MNRFFALFARFAIIVIGYAAASFTASLFMNVVLAGAPGIEMSESDAIYRIGMVLAVGVGTLFTGYYAFLPAMAAIMVAEIAGKRDWVSHAIGGAVIGAAAVTLFWATDERASDQALMMMVIAAGISGASVYWFIAGRNAGSWHTREKTAPVSSSPEEP